MLASRRRKETREEKRSASMAASSRGGDGSELWASDPVLRGGTGWEQQPAAGERQGPGTARAASQTRHLLGKKPSHSIPKPCVFAFPWQQASWAAISFSWRTPFLPV